MSRKVTRCGVLAYVNAKPRRRQSDFDRKRSYEAQGLNPRVSLLSRLIGGAR